MSVRVELNSYTFEGRSIEVGLPEHILDNLAGLAISYKMLSKDRITKAAKEQRALFRGVLTGLELAGLISANRRDELDTFFIGE